MQTMSKQTVIVLILCVVGRASMLNAAETVYQLPDARVGEPYEYGVAYHGLVEPIVYGWSGDWPDGMGGQGAVVFGTPSAGRAKPYRFSLLMEDALSTRLVRDFSLRVRPSIQPLALATDRLPTFIQGEKVAFRIAATGGEGLYRWQSDADRLPAGLKLDCNELSEGCGLSGIAKEIGDIKIRVTVVADTQSIGPITLVGDVAEPPPAALALCEDNPPQAIVGYPYRHRLCVSGGHPPYKWADNWTGAGRPSWIRFNDASGELEGVPDRISVQRFVVTVKDALGKSVVQKTMALDVVPPVARGLLTLLPQSLPTAVVGRWYEATLAILHARGAVHWDIQWDKRPPWMNVEVRGDTVTLSGEPEQSGKWSFFAKAVDRERIEGDEQAKGEVLSSVEQRNFDVIALEEKYAPDPLRIVTETLPAAIVGHKYSVQLAGDGGEGSKKFVLVQAKKAWFNMTSAGLLSGTPRNQGSTEFVVYAEDSEGVRSPTKRLRIESISLSNDILPIEEERNGGTSSGAGSKSMDKTDESG